MRFFISTLILFISFSALYGAEFGTRKMGIEFEYAGQNAALDNSNEETFRWLLEPVREVFGGSEISIQPWNKYSDALNTFYASFIDSQGRKWSAVPEIMNTGGFDGYELITPPLTTPEDIKKAELALVKIEELNLFIPGKSSSSHYTADVSDLIGPNDNVSRIVDLILFLENHTLEIYNLVKPMRYGKAMNSYAIPLSLTQKELLKELAATPPHLRTYKRIRAIFNSYRKKELLLVDKEFVHAWKFRLFNYGKFFKLGNFKERINVFEFRMADLVGKDRFRKLGDIYTTLIDVGSRETQTRFIDPFPNFSEFGVSTHDQFRINQHIKKLPYSKYTIFLNKLGLSIAANAPYQNPFSQPLACKNLFFF